MSKYSRDSFMEQAFAQQLSVVDQGRARAQKSGSELDDMIRSIFGGNKHATVEAKVKDYQEMIGIKPYLESIAKQASIPIREHIDSFVANQLETHHGHVSIPQLQADVLSLFAVKGVTPDQVYNEEFVKHLHDMIQKVKSEEVEQDKVENQLGMMVELDNNDGNDSFFANMESKQS